MVRKVGSVIASSWSPSDTKTRDPVLAGGGGGASYGGGGGAGGKGAGVGGGPSGKPKRQQQQEQRGRQGSAVEEEEGEEQQQKEEDEEAGRPKSWQTVEGGQGVPMRAGRAEGEDKNENQDQGGDASKTGMMAVSRALPMYPYEYEGTLKLVIVGPSGVGKSAMLTRYCDHEFNPMLISTVGVDFKFKDLWIRGKPYRLNIFDTAGQEKFYALSKSFYRGCHGVLLVYDISNRASFLALDKWHREARDNMPGGALLGLVGTKLDRAQDGGREVTYEDGLAKMLAYQASGFYEVSSMSGQNIKKPFVGMVGSILDTPGLLQAVQERPYPATFELASNPRASLMDTVCQC